MSRLIDADALQNILLPITTALEHEYGSLGGAVSGCMKHIDNAPTVDAIPVVRCRECKHHHDCGTHFCDALGMDCPDDSEFFCAYGERKEGADR